MNKFFMPAVLFLVSGVSTCLADAGDIIEMKPVKVIDRMTSYPSENGTVEVYDPVFDLVGRALLNVSNGVCQFKKNTVIRYRDVDLYKADGSKIVEQSPVIEKYSETGRCDDLKKKYSIG